MPYAILLAAIQQRTQVSRCFLEGPVSGILTAVSRGYRKLHGTPAEGVPLWARRAAFLIPLAVLPSGLWRIAQVTFGVPLTKNVDIGKGQLPGWLPLELYVVILSIVAEGLAFLAVGLVSTWGEVWPRWVPFLAGKPVRPLSAIIPAALGAAVLTVTWTTTLVLSLRGRALDGRQFGDGGWRGSLIHDVGDLGWRAWVFVTAYLPLLAWGPLLAAVTYAYAVRRKAFK